MLRDVLQREAGTALSCSQVFEESIQPWLRERNNNHRMEEPPLIQMIIGSWPSGASDRESFPTPTWRCCGLNLGPCGSKTDALLFYFWSTSGSPCLVIGLQLLLTVGHADWGQWQHTWRRTHSSTLFLFKE
ncbi:Hypothetical predicted protein [Podarcis lilfordi]|nr:Hypothetical predicted protein [Podarcis lilfordi]